MSQIAFKQEREKVKEWRRYPAYKDSGVEWLGEVPQHWEVKRLKYIFRVVNGSTPKSGVSEYWDGDIFWVTPDDLGKLKTSIISTTERQISSDGYQSCGTRLVPVGSLVLSTRAPIGHLAIAGIELCTNQGCRCLVFRDADNIEFFYYLLLAARRELELWGQGTTFQELAKGKLEAISLSLPPLPEQQAIAQFLDRETAKIDTLVAKKERLIELLKEKRTALISHAVTKGLNPDAPMKDSEVEWLGEVPEHWKVKRLKYIFRVVNGSTPKSGVSEYWDGDIFWVTPDDLGKLKTSIISTTERQISSDGYQSCGTRLVPVGSLVLSTRAPIGHLAIAGIELCTNQGCRCLVFRDADNIEFFYYLLLAARRELELWGQGTTFQELAKGKLEAISLSLPPLPEQQAIAQFLDRETAKIDTLVAKTRNSIEKLKEYRTALISAAVTGKIDVRND